jgi:hypothetical protein
MTGLGFKLVAAGMLAGCLWDARASAASTDEPAGESVMLDPTRMSPKLRAVILPPPTQQFTPQAAPEQVVAVIPEITVKALVQAAGKPVAALLEINGREQKLVLEGASFSIRGSERQYLTVIARKISGDDVELAIEQLKQTIHVK